MWYCIDQEIEIDISNNPLCNIIYDMKEEILCNPGLIIELYSKIKYNNSIVPSILYVPVMYHESIIK